MSEFKKISICADDFGLNAGICKGIIQLARMQRLSAVSCMVNQPDFLSYAPELLALKNQVQIGLHFNLTDGPLLSSPNTPCFGLKELLVKSHLRMINLSLVAKEFQAQLACFKRVMGCLPDFIDGHQHIHQFPGIRQVILGFYDEELSKNGTYIRSTFPSSNAASYQTKIRVLAAAGGRQLSFDLKRLKIPHNSCFLGVYDFAKGTNYRYLFRQWLFEAPNNSLIMCHPGEKNKDVDAIAHARKVEYDYFMSNEFVQDCYEYAVQLGSTTSPKARQYKRVNSHEPQNHY